MRHLKDRERGKENPKQEIGGIEQPPIVYLKTSGESKLHLITLNRTFAAAILVLELAETFF